MFVTMTDHQLGGFQKKQQEKKLLPPEFEGPTVPMTTVN
jgi:hypothetical protein